MHHLPLGELVGFLTGSRRHITCNEDKTKHFLLSYPGLVVWKFYFIISHTYFALKKISLLHDQAGIIHFSTSSTSTQNVAAPGISSPLNALCSYSEARHPAKGVLRADEVYATLPLSPPLSPPLPT
ncbi:BA75_02833T0 [Komagataella pastoris]|uniref:BA75_02833T0 n=1 Tax=Komagataella pastoris TaxID=4922 RepID=A0A1B2JAP3_PICPA|nr:BA75_02833T0 [Komagataella pastoris]